MTKRMKIRRYELSGYDLDGSLLDLLKKVDDWCTQFGEDASIEFDIHRGYYNEAYCYAVIEYKTEETDKEYNQRLKQEKVQDERRKKEKLRNAQKERKEYERLKKKYEK